MVVEIISMLFLYSDIKKNDMTYSVWNLSTLLALCAPAVIINMKIQTLKFTC